MEESLFLKMFAEEGEVEMVLMVRPVLANVPVQPQVVALIALVLTSNPLEVSILQVYQRHPA